mmetsp:Transcript_37644/g.51651  ORF Transcript_37644/g.51651 Transcript_37644/m.51651 type:complete len:82 (-) Transcript_37644:24-269(-)
MTPCEQEIARIFPPLDRDAFAELRQRPSVMANPCHEAWLRLQRLHLQRGVGRRIVFILYIYSTAQRLGAVGLGSLSIVYHL